MSFGMPQATADEYLIWEDLQPITLRSLTTGFTYLDNMIGNAKRRAIGWKEMAASQGVYTSQDTLWLLPAPELPSGVEPKPGDIVLDGDGTSWTILEAPKNKFKNTRRCTCRNLALAAALASSLNIKRPTLAQDASGKRQVTYPTPYPYSSIACRLQEIGQQIDPAFRDGVAGRKDYTLYVGQRLALQAGDLLSIDGVDYDWAGSANWDRLDQLGEVKVYRVD